MAKPVMALSDYKKPYKVNTDAFDFVIGNVLMREGHPIAYENQKLNDTEWRYAVHEKR